MNFSVLMSVYIKETKKNLDEAIKSILNQTAMPNEIVIIKDGELTKEVDELLTNYENNYGNLFKVYSFSKNRGLGACLKDGIKLCTNDIIARCDSDDISLPNRFELQLKTMKFMNLDIVGSHVVEFDDDTYEYLSIRKVPTTESGIKKAVKFRSPFNHPTVMFKKAAVIEAGNYLDLKFREDYLLWINMMNNNKRAANINKVLVEMRVNKSFYKRRSGTVNFKSEQVLQKKLLEYKMINLPEYARNTVVRGLGTLTPSMFRKVVYKKFLRSNIEKNKGLIYSNKYLLTKIINKDVYKLYLEKGSYYSSKNILRKKINTEVQQTYAFKKHSI